MSLATAAPEATSLENIATATPLIPSAIPTTMRAAVYRGINVPRNALTTSTLSVHVAILAATNDKEGAAKEAASLPKDKLLPEEQALVDEALK